MHATTPEAPVGVVIPAAGSGSRLGGRRKQFRLLGGRPLFVQTASVFQTHRLITAIVLVVAADDVDPVSRAVAEFGLDKVAAVVPGGSTRQESVRHGLHNLPERIGIVLTHDAVRPFVTQTEITHLIERLRQTGAAAIAAPVSDTLVRSENGQAGETVARDGLFRMLTPQGFRRDLLEEGHRAASMAGKTFTDEVTLVRATGAVIDLVEGSPMNIKITTAADWALAQRIWPAWSEL